MVVKDLQLELGQEEDCLLGNLNVILSQLALRVVKLLSASAAPFNEVEHFW